MKATLKTLSIVLLAVPLASGNANSNYEAGDNRSHSSSNSNGGDGSYHTVTLGELQQAFPQGNPTTLSNNLGYLNQAMQEFGINTPTRQAAFLGQVGAETGQLNSMTEIASGTAYAGELGNTNVADAENYKGRGALQLTGKTNYANAGKALGADFVNHPELVATPQYAFRTGGWYWGADKLNTAADVGDIAKITKAIVGPNALNVATTHYDLRVQLTQQALKALGGSNGGNFRGSNGGSYKDSNLPGPGDYGDSGDSGDWGLGNQAGNIGDAGAFP